MYMKLFVVMMAIGTLSAAAFAETTIKVDGDQSVTVTPQNPVVLTPIIVQEVPVVILKEDPAYPKNFEGTIVKVDLPESQIVVRDTENHERRVLIKQGMINTFKVDDYVRINLMADMKEAKMVKIVR